MKEDLVFSIAMGLKNYEFFQDLYLLNSLHFDKKISNTEWKKIRLILVSNDPDSILYVRDYMEILKNKK